jgi:hypothetical protein
MTRTSFLVESFVISRSGQSAPERRRDARVERAEVNAEGKAVVFGGCEVEVEVGRRGAGAEERVDFSSVDGEGGGRAFHGRGKSSSRECTQPPKRNSVAASRANLDAKS